MDSFREEFDTPIGAGRLVTEASVPGIYLIPDFDPSYELTAGGELTASDSDWGDVRLTMNSTWGGYPAPGAKISGAKKFKAGIRYDTSRADAGTSWGHNITLDFSREDGRGTAAFAALPNQITAIYVRVFFRPSTPHTSPSTEIDWDIAVTDGGIWGSTVHTDFILHSADLFSPGTTELWVDLEGPHPKLYVGGALIMEAPSISLGTYAPIEMDFVHVDLVGAAYLSYLRVNAEAPTTMPFFWQDLVGTTQISE